jgi:hypothetical protein
VNFALPIKKQNKTKQNKTPESCIDQFIEKQKKKTTIIEVPTQILL